MTGSFAAITLVKQNDRWSQPANKNVTWIRKGKIYYLE
jgi:hypothetical protein